jgi:hypothetical protein
LALAKLLRVSPGTTRGWRQKPPPPPLKSRWRMRATVMKLRAALLPRNWIARHLGISRSQVDRLIATRRCPSAAYKPRPKKVAAPAVEAQSDVGKSHIDPEPAVEPSEVGDSDVAVGGE